MSTNRKDLEKLENALNEIDAKFIEEAAEVLAKEKSERRGRAGAGSWSRYAAVAGLSLLIVGAAVIAWNSPGRHFYNPVQNGGVYSNEPILDGHTSDRYKTESPDIEGATPQKSIYVQSTEKPDGIDSATDAQKDPTAPKDTEPTPEGTMHPATPAEQPADDPALPGGPDPEIEMYTDLAALEAAINGSGGKVYKVSELTNYYVPDSVPSGAKLMAVAANSRFVALYYNFPVSGQATQGGVAGVFVWSQERLDTQYVPADNGELAKALYEKTWIGERIGAAVGEGQQDVYWIGDNYVFHAIVPKDLTEEELAEFCKGELVVP